MIKGNKTIIHQNTKKEKLSNPMLTKSTFRAKKKKQIKIN